MPMYTNKPNVNYYSEYTRIYQNIPDNTDVLKGKKPLHYLKNKKEFSRQNKVC